MAILFPALPTNGQTYTTAGTTYTYDASKTLWRSDSSVLDWVVPQTPIVIDPANYTNTTYTSAQLLTSIKTVDGPASGLNADLLDGKHASAFASGQDTSLLYLYAAENKGNRLNMVGGIMDPFADQTDVDTVASTNEVFSAGQYTRTPDSSIDQLPTMYASTTSGVSISATGATAGNPPWRVGDNNLSTEWQSGNVGAFNLTVDLGVATTIYSYAVSGATSSAATNDSPKYWIFQGSNDNITWTTLHSPVYQTGWYGSQTRLFSLTVTGSYRYYRLASLIGQGSNWVRISELALNQPFAYNMTLRSNAFTASAVPTTARIGVQASGTFTINTDLTAEVSRDGGTTWAIATLVLLDTLADGTSYYEDAAVSVAAQPAGTAMKYRIKTLNSTSPTVSGVLLQWS